LEEPGYIFPLDEFSIVGLLDQHPVSYIVDFSSTEGLDYCGEVAASRGIRIVSAISNYPKDQIIPLKEFGKTNKVLWSPNITLG
jgi:4-hydroxy-tetrahydrodipicolinate reductase